MLVLGITDGITCGAAVVHDGVVLSAVTEERLSRHKMAYGFPRRSIAEVLRLAGITARDIDLVTAATIDNYLYDGVRDFEGWIEKDKGFIRNAVFGLASRFSDLVPRVPGLEALYYRSRWPIFASRRHTIGRILREEFGIRAPMEFVDHHLAHAASTYFTSGFDEATVVTMDGGGDGLSSRIYEVHDGEFREVTSISAYNSLANYYAYTTHLCGFKAQRHEGKITGLAAHGRPLYLDVLESMITFRDGQIVNVGGGVFTRAVEKLRERLPANWEKADLAASIQKHCEKLAVRYATHHLSPGRPRNVAIAGGLFANVRINQMLFEAHPVERLWVHPGMTDVGLAVGAALTPCIKRRGRRRMRWEPKVMPHVYLGEGYTPAEIERELASAGLSYTRPPSIEREVATLLADGHVVARFNGRMEYGPRALGNRSILYQPADRGVNDWLNEHLNRTEFMPFAPSTLAEYAEDCYRDHGGAKETARFMTITFDCSSWMKQTCPGVVHIDGTARPQLVTREDNPSYHTILDEFRKLTGIPTVINTSFNMHEEPIVCSPGDAIRAFRLGHLDCLAIGDFLVKNPKPVDRPLKAMPRHNGSSALRREI